MKTSVRVVRKATFPWDDQYGNFCLKPLWISGYLVPLWRSGVRKKGAQNILFTELLKILNICLSTTLSAESNRAILVQS